MWTTQKLKLWQKKSDCDKTYLAAKLKTPIATQFNWNCDQNKEEEKIKMTQNSKNQNVTMLKN